MRDVANLIPHLILMRWSIIQGFRIFGSAKSVLFLYLLLNNVIQIYDIYQSILRKCPAF